MPIILKDHNPNKDCYVEPFVGSFNTMKLATGRRIAADIDPYVTALYRAVIFDGWDPPEIISYEEYIEIKNNKDKFPPELVAFVGYGCSFGGKFFAGFARSSLTANFAIAAKGSLLQKAALIDPNNLTIITTSFDNLDIPDCSTVYCDPPYKDTTWKYKFNHEQFWEWAREHSQRTTMFISECSAPDDFVPIWNRRLTSTVNNPNQDKQTKSMRKDALFIHERFSQQYE